MMYFLKINLNGSDLIICISILHPPKKQEREFQSLSPLHKGSKYSHNIIIGNSRPCIFNQWSKEAKFPLEKTVELDPPINKQQEEGDVEQK